MNTNQSTMTNDATRVEQAIQRMLRVDGTLGRYSAQIQISIENAVVTLRGRLPDESLRDRLVPIVRQAGVLWRVRDHVDVAR